MKNLLSIEALTKSVGDRMLFADVTFGVDEGDKIGVIAKNGTGKSTMLSIIAGHEAADSGSVTVRDGVTVGYLPQTPDFDPEASVIEWCLAAGTPAADAIIRYETILADADHDPADLTAAATAMDAASAWDYEDRIRQLLTQLHIDDMSARLDTLSGGQRKRVALARVLLAEPSLLILDEPTNHLDISTIEWLEERLRRNRMALLMVTHDRYFLDRVCNRIIEIDMAQIFTCDGNYDYYLRRRAERIEALEGELARVKNTLRKEQEWMRRQPQARAGKARYRIDRFYDLKERARADYTERNIRLNEATASYIGKKIFEAEHVNKRFGDKVILDDFTYNFARGERLGIVGENGVGKSTFIKMLQGLVAPDSGAWNVGETVRFGYYSQEGINLPAGKRVIDAVTDFCEDVALGGDSSIHVSPMQFLTRFLFTPADQQKYISTLSGGERARLHLATVLMRQPNFLILDEPTNDLDIVTLGILEEYLATFKGCLIVVSHDRFFLDSIVDHLFVMEGNGVVRDFPGNYTELRAYRREQQAEAAQAVKADKPSTPERSAKPRPAKLSFKERKEMEALEAEIAALEAEKSELDALFSSGKQLDNVDALYARYSEIKDQLDRAEMRWLELSEKPQ